MNDIKGFLPPRPETRVGESWELSAGPDFPSGIDDGSGASLGDKIAADPTGWLGSQAASGCTLLVKLLDAAQHLSLQIHPTDDYEGLKPGQGGKPESWYVIDHEPGAGVYLGFAPGVDRERVASAVRSGDDLSALMCFVPVEVGDFIVLDAGTPHAVGAGVTLVEPQRVMPGREGVTYRYWDWNRRYDATGRLCETDEGGAPRDLHLDHALEVTDWLRATDPFSLAQRRFDAGTPVLTGPARLLPLCGPPRDGAVRSDALRVARLSGTGALEAPDWRCLRALTVLEGHVDVGELRIGAGRTAAIPAAVGALQLGLADAHAILSATT